MADKLPELFKGFKINKYYKFIGYLFGIVFILTLFIDPSRKDIESLRTLSLWFIIGAMSSWFIERATYYALGIVDGVFYKRQDENFFGTLVLVGSIGLQIYVWYYILKNKLGMI